MLRHTAAIQRDLLVTVKKNFVSFYFTNVSHDISYISLRQGFEVCDVLEDVYLARKRNVNGGAFGFVHVVRGEEAGREIEARSVDSGNVAMEVVTAGKMFVPKYTST